MKTVYVVRAVPVRRLGGAIVGWVRVDPLADGTKATDMVFLADGTACSQLEAMELVAGRPGLLYPTQAAAVNAGIARLRQADGRGELVSA